MRRHHSAAVSYTGRTDTMCARHGVALAILAWALVGDRDTALTVVARTLAATCLQPADHLDVDLRDQRRALSRDIYQRCLRQPVQPSTVAGRYAADDDVEELIRQLRELSPSQRDPVLLCSLGGHTYRDAADLLRTSAENVASRLRSGLRALAATDQPAHRQSPSRGTEHEPSP